MRLIGTVGNDWTRRSGVRGGMNDAALRAWRDFLEDQLSSQLGVDAEISLGKETRFSFHGPSDHTIVEIEAFARKCLDDFLNREARKEIYGK